MPIYEYRCEDCKKRSSALLPAWSAPDPPCSHCGSARVGRLVSTFATVRSGDGDDLGDSDFGGGDEFGGDEFGAGEDMGFGGGFGDEDF
jgi:putative FmdB family regulatory protein